MQSTAIKFKGQNSDTQMMTNWENHAYQAKRNFYKF